MTKQEEVGDREIMGAIEYLDNADIPTEGRRLWWEIDFIREEIRDKVIVNITKACPTLLNREILELADNILKDEDSQGIVIKVDGELPCSRCKGNGSIEVGILRGGVFKGNDIDCPDCKGSGKAGYVAVEPLIEEE